MLSLLWYLRCCCCCGCSAVCGGAVIFCPWLSRHLATRSGKEALRVCALESAVVGGERSVERWTASEPSFVVHAMKLRGCLRDSLSWRSLLIRCSSRSASIWGKAISWMVMRLDSEAWELGFVSGRLPWLEATGEKRLGKSLVMQLRRVGTQEQRIPTFSSTLLQSAETGLS